jgi:hypothetical protein
VAGSSGLSGITRLLCPAEWAESIYAIDLDDLRRRGVRGLVFDLDNTLIPWRSPRPPAELAAWFSTLGRLGFKACIVSNNSVPRVNAFASALGVPAVARASKPRRRAFHRAMALLGTTAAETAVVGDQMFTDVLGGNRLGMYTILVTPVSRWEFPGTMLVRRVEALVLARLRRRGLLGKKAPPRGGDAPHPA